MHERREPAIHHDRLALVRRHAPGIQGTRQAGRTQLTEFESKELLRTYGIPVVDTRVASSEEEAVQLAAAIGFPVVLKLHSETITHKTDVDGVKLSLADEQAARRAFREIESSDKPVYLFRPNRFKLILL